MNKNMISYLSGKIISKKEKFVVIEVNNIGYKVFLSRKSLAGLGVGKDIKVFCFLNVKENGLELYGFLDEKELEFFGILDSIRGVGPKAALEISSLGPLEKIKERILAQDEKLFDGIPGIGRKKAGTIILELSGKIKVLGNVPALSEIKDDVLDTLASLGFSRQQASNALKEVSKDIKDSEKRLKEALKILGK